ncbi:hypothetical protein EMCRGX_G033497 [Ephydatia muelleri]
MAGKPVCKYGASCYRKNAEHLQSFSHPHTANETPSPSSQNELPESLPAAKRTKKEDVGVTTQSKTEIASSSGTPELCRKQIKEQFLVDMPDDFTQFWDLCKSLDSCHPELALMPALNLELVGPFHVLQGQLTGVPWQQCVLQDRYFYDPPEVVTVLRSDDDRGFHLGYFRDDPKSVDCLVVSNCANVDCEFRIEGNNLFSAVRFLLKNKLQDKSIKKTKRQELEHIESLIKNKAEELHLDMQEPKGLTTKRNRTINAKCFHKIGLSVPFDKSTEVGYRPLPVTDGELRKILDRIAACSVEAKRPSLMEPLQEIVTYVQFANDECDYGMGLELGLDLFMHGDQFHSLVLNLLPLAYELLYRDEYARIIKEHVHHRDRTPLNICVTFKTV